MAAVAYCFIQGWGWRWCKVHLKHSTQMRLSTSRASARVHHHRHSNFRTYFIKRALRACVIPDTAICRASRCNLYTGSVWIPSLNGHDMDNVGFQCASWNAFVINPYVNHDFTEAPRCAVRWSPSGSSLSSGLSILRLWPQLS